MSQKLCGREWSVNSCGSGRLSPLGESDPSEQSLCGRVEDLTEMQEMRAFLQTDHLLGGLGCLQHRSVKAH